MKLSLITVKKSETYLDGHEWKIKSIYYLFGFIPLARNIKTFPCNNNEKEQKIEKIKKGILNDSRWLLFGFVPVFRLEITHTSKLTKEYLKI